MLSSIHPLGERSRRNRWWLTVTAHLVGGVVGGLALGAGAWLVGWPLRLAIGGTAAVALAAIAVGAAAVAEASGVRPPGPARQVDERWVTTYRGWVYGLGYGVQLGVGVSTFVTSAATWATVVVVALVPEPAVALTLGAVYGGTRGATPLLARRADRPERLHRLVRSIEARERPARAAAAAILAVTGIALGAVALGGGA